MTPWLAGLGFKDYLQAMRQHLQIRPGMRVLDIGCGQGFLSTYLAHNGAEVLGCDISPRSIETCNRRAALSNVADRCTFKVMDCEALEVESESLDAVAGCFVLHHLNLAKVAKELTRVLKPGAKSAFIETMGLNGALMAARAVLPGKFGIEKASSDDEYPLTRKRIAMLRKNFDGPLGLEFPQIVFLRMGGYLPFLQGGIAQAGLTAIDRALGRIPGSGSLSYYGIVTMDRTGTAG
ncbi:MAG: class I SAM-dependent methyltransferase [Pseudorhodobacter sp.]|nr:class I SAM-dependent methyltransferase [Pseudorhodobacter sp.]MDN5785908.1 class I SAM-dependent methyltransferase [Pseudorhodobacter sp.]